MNSYVLKTVVSKTETGAPVIAIPRNAKVMLTGKFDETSSEVVYYGKIGWVPSVVLEKNTWEENIHLSNQVVIEPSLTPVENVSAAQYLKVAGKLKFNLCGEFCAAYLAGVSIGEFLEQWKLSYPVSYDTFVKKDLPTGIPALQSMAATFHLENQPFVSPFITKEGYIFSANRLGEKCASGWGAIVGVKINGQGDVTGQGLTSHWVVITSAYQTQRQNGIVSVYNPFSNLIESYTFLELLASMSKFGNATGLWVKKA